jgi:hypothetical protein
MSEITVQAKKEEKMNTNRKTAVIVGILYILGTVAGILSLVFSGSMQAADYLVEVPANASQIVAGALLVLLMGVALAMIPVLMFPILKKQNEVLALGYVVFRGALEMFTYIASAISFLMLLTVGREFVQAGAPVGSYFQTLGASLLEANTWISQIVTIVFILGAVMFYYLLYRSKLVPRWISAWGLIGAMPYFVAGLLIMFGQMSDMASLDTVLRFPILLQELVLAVWLIVKGFNPSAIAALSAKTE